MDLQFKDHDLFHSAQWKDFEKENKKLREEINERIKEIGRGNDWNNDADIQEMQDKIKQIGKEMNKMKNPERYFKDQVLTDISSRKYEFVWYKNKQSQVSKKKKGTIQYFKYTLEWNGTNYVVVAHIHGIYKNNKWEYDGDDKVEVFEENKYEMGSQIQVKSNVCDFIYKQVKHLVDVNGDISAANKNQNLKP